MKKFKTMKRPELEDFYDELDPRGCSSSEYNEYEKALKKWEDETNRKNILGSTTHRE